MKVGAPPQGYISTFLGGASPYALYNLYNISSLINKFNNKYIAFKTYLKLGGLEAKDHYLREAW